jgi:SAM-dependent methyltransferase
MRPSIKKYVKICGETLPIQEPIYEFGSMQVSGQEGFADLRPYFPGMKYIGADMSQGTGVDVILDLHNINLPSESVGTVISCDTLEHVEFPRKALTEIYRILKPNGVLIITSVMLYNIHNAPNDYWRFTPEGFKSLLSQFQSSYVDWNGKKENPHTVVGIGSKTEYNFDQLKAKRNEWRMINDTLFYPAILSLWYNLIVDTKALVKNYFFEYKYYKLK